MFLSNGVSPDNIPGGTGGLDTEAVGRFLVIVFVLLAFLMLLYILYLIYKIKKLEYKVEELEAEKTQKSP